MRQDDVTRRDFGRLTMAAFAGVAAGVVGPRAFAADDENDPKKHILLQEPHVCCGLNACKGKAADKENACAGTGHCATAEKHGCHGENVCKGQGGCGANPGENACKGKGECAVPLSEKSWKNARKNFEAAAKAADIKVGKAPEGCPKG